MIEVPVPIGLVIFIAFCCGGLVGLFFGCTTTFFAIRRNQQ